MKKLKPSVHFLLSVITLLSLSGCGENLSPAESLIQESIAAHGGGAYDSLQVRWNFRGESLQVYRNPEGKFQYIRTQKDSAGIQDILRNEGFSRYQGGRELSLSEAENSRLSQLVNSRVYFALLPYILKDPAVQAEILSETEIMGKPYQELKVTFAAENGGVDHEDIYIYWIHQKSKEVHYFAYSYAVNGGGTRFREAYNPRRVGGVLWQDYYNYAGPAPGEVPLEDFDELFENNKLEKVSEINLSNIREDRGMPEPGII